MGRRREGVSGVCIEVVVGPDPIVLSCFLFFLVLMVEQTCWNGNLLQYRNGFGGCFANQTTGMDHLF